MDRLLCNIDMVNSQQARIRRLQDTLIIAGDAVVAFSAWGLLKAALFFILTDSATIDELFGSVEEQLMVFVVIVLVVMVGIDLALRLFIGLSARSEGRGKKKRPIYLVVASLAALANFASAIMAALGMAYTLSAFDTVVTIAVELTSFAALATVVYCSVRLRGLNKATG